LLRGTITVVESKSAAGRRTFTLPTTARDMLTDHLQRRGVTGAVPDAYVFVGPRGGSICYSNFRTRVWLPAVKRAALHRFTPHDLRRAAATAMVAAGADGRTAQTRLGHSDPRLTIGLYAQSTSDGDRSAAARVDDYFAPHGALVGESSDGPNSLVHN